MISDLRLAFRMLVKNPGLTGIAVLALALGIGLTTIMFSIVYGALLRGLPFDQPYEIVHLERNNLSADIEGMEVSIHDYVDWRKEQRSFEDLAAFYSGTVNISGQERAERFDGSFITPNAFPMLGVQPIRGRLFREEEGSPGAPGVALLGYEVWRDRYGSDDDVVGRSIRVNGEQMTVVGVMPEGFFFPAGEQVWIPLRDNPLEFERGEGRTFEVFGRLRDGESRDRAFLDMSGIADRLAKAYPESNEGVGVVIQPFTDEFVGDDAKGLLFTMLAAVFLVLIIACANVANLLLARAALRGKEVAVRSAVGASRFRVIRQLLVESTALALVGGGLGLLIAAVGIRVFRSAIQRAEPPFWMEFGLLPPVVLFVLGLTLLAGVIAGVVPALQASGADINAILKDESRGSSGFRIGRISRGLVMVEIALSVALLCGAGLMIKSVTNLRTTDFGFDTQSVLTARVGLFEADYPDEESRRQFFESVVDRVQRIPEAQSAALTTALPGTGSCCWRFAPEGATYDRDQDYPQTARSAVTPDFFETFGIDVRQGRVFTLQDGPGNLPVAVVNQRFEDEFFPDGASGQRVRLGASDSESPWLTVVGVVDNTYMGGIGNDEDPNRAGLFVPVGQSDSRFMSLAVRTRGAPLAVTGAVREAVEAVDKNVPIYWARTMDDALSRNTWFYDIFGGLFMIFGAAALFLASVGLYGVMSFGVSRRIQEVGIRMALGARSRDVIRLIVRQGAVQIAVGVVVGLGLAVLLARFLRVLLFEVSPTDPLIFASIVGVLAGTGFLATWIPARRASRVDPMVAFRCE